MKKMISVLLRFLVSGILLTSLAACGFMDNSSEPPIIDTSVPAIRVNAGQVITFANGEAGGAQNGWANSETNGTWSNSDKTVLYLDYDSTFDDGMNLLISMSSFVIDKNPSVSASIKANGEPVGGVDFNLSKSSGDAVVKISKEILSKNKGRVVLTFDITGAAVPKEVGYNLDERKVGIFLTQMIATPTT